MRVEVADVEVAGLECAAGDLREKVASEAFSSPRTST
jgi:hypothetical protein